MNRTFATIAEIREANAAAGHFWFEPATMRFFRSRVYRPVVGGRFFVSSKQFCSLAGDCRPRTYAVQVVDDRGHVDTVDGHDEYATLKEARAAADRLDAAGETFDTLRAARHAAWFGSAAS